MTKKKQPAEVAEETVPAAESVETREMPVVPAEEAASSVPPVEKAAPVLYKVTWAQGLNLRQDPGREHRVLRVLACGSLVEARGEAVDVNGTAWLPVQDGWVDAAYLAEVPAEV